MQKNTAQDRKFRVAILGTRGIPARYGGFETFAEELTKQLTLRGHEVAVYCRRFFCEARPILGEYHGAKLIYLPTVRHKYLETLVHSLISFFDLFRRRFDVVILCNAANSPFSFLVRFRMLPLIINVDGIERKRAKWNSLGRLWYRIGEIASVWFASRIVADARVIADYYLRTYRSKSTVIAYGGRAVKKNPAAALSELGLAPQSYLLYVSRLEPENNAIGVVEAYGLAKCTLPLVIIGDAPYADNYKANLKRKAAEIEDKNREKKVIFGGFRFGDHYHELQSNCYFYIQATEVGGTHPALVEAMAHGNCVIANGTPENVEVLGEAGLFYEFNNFAELAKQIDLLTNDPASCRRFREAARLRAQQRYSWETICDQYLALFSELVKR